MDSQMAIFNMMDNENIFLEVVWRMHDNEWQEI